MSDEFNDNGAMPGRGLPQSPDPHGHAALLLVESLIHGLIDRGVIDTKGAVEIVQVAAEVNAEAAEDPRASPQVIRQSTELLHAVAASLQTDLAE